MHDDNGTVIGFTKVTHDLTERKLAEEEKERDRKNIEVQNRQLKEFAYITSHDLQEPIRKIQTFINLAQKNRDNKEILDTYFEMSQSAQKMVFLIKDVLSFSRLSQDRSHHSDTNLEVIVHEVLEELDLLIHEKNVKITTTALPVIQAIPVQMHQLLCNLLHNAIKFSDDAPRVTIGYRTLDKTGTSGALSHHYEITVSDNGIGFDERYAEIAFQPFKQLNSNHQGTGIGVAICKRIVENHDGTISVASQPGKGTTFTVSLPIF